MQTVTGVILFFWACEDMRYKKLRHWRLGVGAGILLALAEIGDVFSIWRALWGLLPGIILLMSTAFGPKGRTIGEADGVVFLVLGLLYGLWGSLTILVYSLMLFCLLAGGLFLAKRVERKERLPFLPFVWGGYLLCWLTGCLGTGMGVAG